MKNSINFFMYWIILMFCITFTCFVAYATAQQSIRLGANERPKELALSVIVRLNNGENVNNIVLSKIDITKSLEPFVLIYNNDKRLLGTNGLIGTDEATYPTGVFSHVPTKGDHRVTWQPQKSLRFASVVLKYNNGYIVAAQSLSERENTIDIIGREMLIGWLLTSLLVSLFVWLFYKLNKNKNHCL